jgi:hypothetical protein
MTEATADMGGDAMEVVRVTPWKTKAGEALRRRDEIVAAGGSAIVVFEMPVGWHVKEVPHGD